MAVRIYYWSVPWLLDERSILSDLKAAYRINLVRDSQCPSRPACDRVFFGLVRTESRDRGFDECANIKGGTVIGRQSMTFALVSFGVDDV